MANEVPDYLGQLVVRSPQPNAARDWIHGVQEVEAAVRPRRPESIRQLAALAVDPPNWAAFASLEAYLVSLLLDGMDIEATLQRQWTTVTFDVLLTVRDSVASLSEDPDVRAYAMLTLPRRLPMRLVTVGALLVEADQAYGPAIQEYIKAASTLPMLDGPLAASTAILAETDLRGASTALGLMIGKTAAGSQLNK